MSTSKTKIDNFLDNHCKIEWESYPNIKSKKELEMIEKELIRNNYLPLNWQNTKGILSRKHRYLLTDAKNRVRK